MSAHADLMKQINDLGAQLRAATTTEHARVEADALTVAGREMRDVAARLEGLGRDMHTLADRLDALVNAARAARGAE